MLKLAGAVAALGSSPSKLLDVYAPVSEAYPGPRPREDVLLGPSHPVSVASDAALAGLLDASRCCVRDLSAFIRAHYPWRMPQAGEVHPCVGFSMGYFRCMLRNRVSLYFVLAGGGGDEPTMPFEPSEGGLVAELISCLEAVLEEKSGALAFPGLRQVFMLNTTPRAPSCAAPSAPTSCCSCRPDGSAPARSAWRATSKVRFLGARLVTLGRQLRREAGLR